MTEVPSRPSHRPEFLDHKALPKIQGASQDGSLTNSSGSSGYAFEPRPAQDGSRVFSSRLPGFYELPITERLDICCQLAGLNPAEAAHLHNFGALNGPLVDVFIENAIGTLPLPLGVATNFHINGQDVLVPMAVEETSVLAAASHGAKLARAGGGFHAVSTRPVMTGQIQIVLKPRDGSNHDKSPAACWAERTREAEVALGRYRETLIAYANGGHERLIERGGGALSMDWHFIPEMESAVIHLYIDTQDAMGANIVNTMCEKVSSLLPEILPCEVGLRILTNLTDRRITKVNCLVPWTALKSGEPGREFDGRRVVDRIVMAYQFAQYDIHRAATNNKGIMNGIDPVLIATGNDWRAIEAGAHAYTCRSGRYGPMAQWSKTADGHLEGTLELPMAVGVVGGVTRLHPTAKAALKIMGSPSANGLAQIVVSVGLAQNLSALRALATEGIQRGHMGLHQANLEMVKETLQRGGPQGASAKASALSFSGSQTLCAVPSPSGGGEAL